MTTTYPTRRESAGVTALALFGLAVVALAEMSGRRGLALLAAVIVAALLVTDAVMDRGSSRSGAGPTSSPPSAPDGVPVA